MKYVVAGIVIIIFAMTFINSSNLDSKFLEEFEDLPFLKEKHLKESKKFGDDEITDVNMTFDEIVTHKKYPLKIYFVTTSDGYILKLYRIPGPKGTKSEDIPEDPTRKVVLLMHGLFDSSDSWITNYESKALAFVLANKGYDVWMGNNRGNKHSRNHLTLNPNFDKEFWNYSFHEMGLIDLPALIEFILKSTGRKKISYIGHSQGTAQLFAAASLEPKYFSDRLNCFFALGPITNISNPGSTFLKLAALSKIDYLFSYLGLNEILEDGDFINRLQSKLCSILPSFCGFLLELIADVNYGDDDMARFLVFLSHFPSGTSLKTLQHFADNIRNHRFTQYGQVAPYPLTDIKDLPIFLYVGADDELATSIDNRNLRDILGPVVQWYKEYEGMGHATFFLSKTNEHLKDLIPELDKINE